MTDQTIPGEKLRALLNQWEGFTRDELHHVSAAGVLKELRDLLPPVLPDRLFLAKATHPDHGEGVVISHFPDVDGTVRFMVPDEAIVYGTSFRWVPPAALKFHTLDHPEYLETEEDYRSAPEGTIVANDDERPAVLVDELWRHIGSVASFYHSDMAGVRRRVLRWGWEA